MLTEGHLPITIEAAKRIDAYCKRGNLRIFLPSTGEKIPYRALNRGLFLMIPIDAQNLMAPVPGGSHPNLLNSAGAINVGDLPAFSGCYHYSRRYLPALSEFASGAGAYTLRGHPAFPFAPAKVFGADRSTFCRRHPAKIAHIHTKPVESHAVASDG